MKPGASSARHQVRKWSEQWMSEQPCPACATASLEVINESARDLVCRHCGEFFELKASTAKWPLSAPAGSVDKYQERFAKDPPNLAILCYSKSDEGLTARALTVIPRTLVSGDMVIANSPSTLSSGRVVRLCRLDLTLAPHLGRVNLWTEGIRHPKDAVASRMQMWLALVTGRASSKQWHRAVLQVIGWINTPQFTRKQLKAFEPWFEHNFPAARTPMQTVSRCLQDLRDADLIEFVERGVYRMR